MYECLFLNYTQLTFTGLKSRIETQEKGFWTNNKKLTIKTPERRHWLRSIFLFLTLNMFHFFLMFYYYFEQANVSWVERFSLFTLLSNIWDGVFWENCFFIQPLMLTIFAKSLIFISILGVWQGSELANVIYCHWAFFSLKLDRRKQTKPIINI